MVKKIYLLLFLCLMMAVPSFVYAYSDNGYEEELNSFKQHFKGMIPYYQKIYDCFPYSVNMEVNYSIIGKENNKCHVKIGSANCYLPMNIAKQYSTTGVNFARKKLDEIITKKEYHFSTDEKEWQYFNSIQNQYCKF